MNKILFLLFLPTFLLGQNPCEELLERFEFPIAYSIQSPMEPDPCDALADYGTVSELIYAPKAGYQEIKKRVRVVSETTWDADNCIAQTNILSRDTIEISNKIYGRQSGEGTGGYWTVRMELLILPPQSRPEGSMCTKLPSGALTQTYKDGSTRELKDYWVVHYGIFQNQPDAKQACKEFKRLHPEFCRAYAYWLLEGCEYQYQYKSNLIK